MLLQVRLHPQAPGPFADQTRVRQHQRQRLHMPRLRRVLFKTRVIARACQYPWSCRSHLQMLPVQLGLCFQVAAHQPFIFTSESASTATSPQAPPTNLPENGAPFTSPTASARNSAAAAAAPPPPPTNASNQPATATHPPPDARPLGQA